MSNPDNVLSAMLQSLFISRDNFDQHSKFRKTPFPYFQNADYPMFMMGGGQYIKAGDWSNLADNQFHHFRVTADGRLMVDATITVSDSAVGSTDGINIDAGLRVSASWRSEALLWGLDIGGTEIAGQVETDTVNAVPFRPLMIGAANLLGVPKALLVDTATGRLLVDANMSSSFTQRFYVKASVTNVDQTIALGFTATEITIMNDDGTNPIYFNYSAPATITTDEVLAGDGFVDNFESNNVHLISTVAGPTTVRVFARA